MDTDYEVIIVGCGPAGLAAGLYAGRSRLKVLLLAKKSAGGEIRGLEHLENYPGFPDGISGAKLGMEMMKQAMKYGLQFKLADVEQIQLQGDYKLVKANIIRGGEETYLTKTVIIAGGAHPRKLGVPGESEFAGKGVSYCGVCDAPQFAERVTAVAGGGDAGLTEALYLTQIASEVIVIEMMPELTASKILQERALSNPKIKICCGTRIEAITGNDRVEQLDLLKVSTNERTTLPVGGILVRIGLEPNTSYLRGLLSLDSGGFVLVNEEMETSVPGIFAAGDIRHASARQIATAVGDGVTAALSAGRLIKLKY
ncbi:FAD-dependent oxidoreductase [candidate division WOR-3 bacterium]|nr:FAD-dependent oxidoreductase [candidate division WOR-3 bacterium]